MIFEWTNEDEMRVRDELDAMVALYDGSVPFPQWATAYLQEHPSRYNFNTLIRYIQPINDPRWHPVHAKPKE